MASGSLCPEPDRRGKHSHWPHKVPEQIHKKVREHIMSFPARQSHYSIGIKILEGCIYLQIYLLKGCMSYFRQKMTQNT